MQHTPSGPDGTRRSLTAPLVALFAAVFGFLPIANWIPGGRDAPWYGVVASSWLSGSAIVLGVGLVLAILSRQVGVLWRAGALDGVTGTWERRPKLTTAVIALVALGLSVVIALHVFSGRPLFIDGLTQMVQAQILAGGHLWRPSGAHPEFFSSMLVVDAGGRHFSQFPVGGPAMLLPAVLVGAPWLAGPLWGAVAVVAFAAFVRVAEPRAGVALGALLLFAFAPFALFMSGSHMNHVPALMWLAIAMAAMARVMTADTPRPWMALLNGFALGAAATIRPVDAFAFAVPAGVWYLARALRDRSRWRDALASAAGVALPMLALLWVNRETTGSPLLFGYELLWGSSHRLGFHAAPWGIVHTPARGAELISLYFLELQRYLYEAPIPSLLPAIAALALTRRLGRFDRYLLASAGLLVGFYFAYWSNGFYLGPRFLYPLLPVLALYTARVVPLVRERFRGELPYRTVVYGAACAALIACTTLVPLRAEQYRASLVTMRWNADSAAAAAGVRHALVFVRESWGAELLARLWALGVPRSEAESVYGNVDACILEYRLDALEADDVRGMPAYETLRPLLTDSAALVGSPFSPDTSERYRPGLAYSPRCAARIDADREGFTLLMPLLLVHGGDNIYARDLGARDSLLVREYPDRPVYLVRPPSSRIGETPRFYPLRRDSVLRAWGGEGAR